jgi:Ca2+-binding RTX toxin-like protein
VKETIMSDLKKAQLELAKFKAEVNQLGLDTSFINNDVHLSNHLDSPSFGMAGVTNDFIWHDTTTGGDVYGGAGSDIFVGTPGVSETFHGGTGNDTVAYVNATEGMTLILGEMPNPNPISAFGQSGAAAGDLFDSIENVVGTRFDDTIFGDENNNKIYGGDGNDHLFGMEGIDKLYGGNGNDVLTAGVPNPHNAVQPDLTDPYSAFFREELHGEAGNDILLSGPNRDLLDGGTEILGVPIPPPVMLGGQAIQGDTASYENSNAGVMVNLAAGQASGGYAEGDTLQGIENLIGSDFRDILTGDAGANVLVGGLGNDSLTGGGGNDTFLFRFDHGSPGFDVVTDLSSGDKVVLDQDTHAIHLSQVGVDTIVTVDSFVGGITLRDIDALSLSISHNPAGTFELHL